MFFLQKIKSFPIFSNFIVIFKIIYGVKYSEKIYKYSHYNLMQQERLHNSAISARERFTK